MVYFLRAGLALLPPLSGALFHREPSNSVEVEGRTRDQEGGEGDRPFDPEADGILVFSEGKSGTMSLQGSAGSMMVPPCHPSGNGATAVRAVKCHSPDCAEAFLKNRPTGSRIWVIGSNRDMFSQYPSGFFQNVLKRYTLEELQNAPVNQLLTEFREKYNPSGRWWTHNYYKAFGINVTAYPFDFQKKFLHLTQEWNNRHLEIIIVRVEDSQDWEQVLKPFFPSIHIQQWNYGSDKVYAEKYKEFLSAISWTDKDIERTLRTESMAHFYTPAERELFARRARSSSLRRADSEDLRIEEDVVEDAC